MEVTATRLGPVTYLTPDGPLVEGNLPSLEGDLRQAYAGGPANVVFDMRQTTTIDSRGLELLLDLAAKLKDAGGSLRLANVNPLCREILSLTRLDREIVLCDETDECAGEPLSGGSRR